MKLALVGLLGLAACFSPVFSEHPFCGPQQECPTGTQCLGGLTCVTKDCSGVPDDEQCANDTVENGICSGQVCVAAGCGDGLLAPGEECDDGSANSNTAKDACRTNCVKARCGDHVIDTGEVCDDGNSHSGDGCSADCRSLETCGNNIVDESKGEACDEGVPGLSGDGCSSSCSLEVDRWKIAPVASIPVRYGHGMASDPLRRKIVIFGGQGQGSSRLADTWELDGPALTQRAVSNSPSPRVAPIAAFDPARGKLVLFGGQDDFGLPLGDTWEFDGATWTELFPAVSPPSISSSAAVTFDSKRGKIVLFGGDSRNDTWEFDGTTWAKRALNGPPPMDLTAMAFDSVRGVTVLFGGRTTTSLVADTWEYDGTTWKIRAPASSPPARGSHAMAFDPKRGRLVMFGGANAAGLLADTWEYDGTTWSQYDPSFVAPSASDSHRMTFDPTTGTVVLFGGGGALGAIFGDVWDFDGTGWTLRPTSPSPRSFLPKMAFDPSRGKAVFFGGASGGQSGLDNVLAQTWEFDGATWALRDPPNHPSPRGGHAHSL